MRKSIDELDIFCFDHSELFLQGSKDTPANVAYILISFKHCLDEHDDPGACYDKAKAFQILSGSKMYVDIELKQLDMKNHTKAF